MVQGPAQSLGSAGRCSDRTRGARTQVQPRLHPEPSLEMDVYFLIFQISRHECLPVFKLWSRDLKQAVAQLGLVSAESSLLSRRSDPIPESPVPGKPAPRSPQPQRRLPSPRGLSLRLSRNRWPWCGAGGRNLPQTDQTPLRRKGAASTSRRGRDPRSCRPCVLSGAPAWEVSGGQVAPAGVMLGSAKV